ncbi:MAG: hypothetical protein M3Y53_00140 [Thermoproteota archaeon]|nr:hypothetical protein [Thermoproteota archaeon]
MDAVIVFFMSLKMTLAEIIIAVPTMPARQCITHYALSYWLVIVIVLIAFVVLLHGANVLSYSLEPMIPSVEVLFSKKSSRSLQDVIVKYLPFPFIARNLKVCLP